MDLSNFEIFVGIGALVGGAILSFSIVSHIFMRNHPIIKFLFLNLQKIWLMKENIN